MIADLFKAAPADAGVGKKSGVRGSDPSAPAPAQSSAPVGEGAFFAVFTAHRFVQQSAGAGVLKIAGTAAAGGKGENKPVGDGRAAPAPDGSKGQAPGSPQEAGEGMPGWIVSLRQEAVCIPGGGTKPKAAEGGPEKVPAAQGPAGGVGPEPSAGNEDAPIRVGPAAGNLPAADGLRSRPEGRGGSREISVAAGVDTGGRVAVKGRESVPGRIGADGAAAEESGAVSGGGRTQKAEAAAVADAAGRRKSGPVKAPADPKTSDAADGGKAPQGASAPAAERSDGRLQEDPKDRPLLRRRGRSAPTAAGPENASTKRRSVVGPARQEGSEDRQSGVRSAAPQKETGPPQLAAGEESLPAEKGRTEQRHADRKASPPVRPDPDPAAGGASKRNGQGGPFESAVPRFAAAAEARGSEFPAPGGPAKAAVMPAGPGSEGAEGAEGKPAGAGGPAMAPKGADAPAGAPDAGQSHAADPKAREADRENVERIVRRAVYQIRNGRQEARIDLKPDHMGQVRMEIAADRNAIHVKILAELPAAKEMLEANLQELKNELANQGLQVERFEVSLSQDGRAGAGGQGAGRGRPPRSGPKGSEDDSHSKGESGGGLSGPEQGSASNRTLDCFA